MSLAQRKRDQERTTMHSPRQTAYSRYHPKWYRRPVSVWWWLESWRYTKFVLRELTSVAVGFFALELLLELRALAKGAEAYARFLARLHNPILVALNLLAFAFVLFHSITWFNLAPKAMQVRVRGKRLPDALISGSNYAVWAVISGALAWFLLR
jgi:fumarate reductase subunit C